MNHKSLKRILSLNLAFLLFLLSFSSSVFAASNNQSAYQSARNAYKGGNGALVKGLSYLNGILQAGYDALQTVGTGKVKNNKGKKVSKYKYYGDKAKYDFFKNTNYGKMAHNDTNKNLIDPKTGKRTNVGTAIKNGTAKNMLDNAESNEPDINDEEYEDDSLGMCGDAFESFTKAVNKFYATVKTLIEQVLPKPIDYIPRGWGWAQEFAKAFGAIGISLCFIFWGIGYLKSNARFLRDRNFNTIMLPFVRAGVAAALSAQAFDLVQNILQGGLRLVSTIAKTQLPGKSTGEMSLESMQKVANDVGSLGPKKLLLWVEIMLATVGVKLMMFVIVGFVIVKFFKMFIYAAVAPLPIASLAGENTQQHAFSYLKALLGVILECLVICMALELFLHGIFTPAGEPVKRLIPEISGETDNGEILMGYIENVLVWMFATTAIVFGSDRLVTKAFGN